MPKPKPDPEAIALADPEAEAAMTYFGGKGNGKSQVDVLYQLVFGCKC